MFCLQRFRLHDWAVEGTVKFLLIFVVIFAILIAHFSSVVSNFDHNRIIRASYIYEANLPALTVCQALYVSEVRVSKNQTGAIVARTGHRSGTHLRERPRIKTKPSHCAGIQIDSAIVRVYKRQPLCWCIETKYTLPADLQVHLLTSILKTVIVLVIALPADLQVLRPQIWVWLLKFIG